MKLFSSKSTILLPILFLISITVHQTLSTAEGWDTDEDTAFSDEKPSEDNPKMELHSHDHDHAAHSPSDGNDSKTAAQGEPRQVGSNVSGHNETCGNDRVCNVQKSLECSSINNTCLCEKDKVYIPSVEGCVQVAVRARGDGDCQHNQQCQQGLWGRNSRCNPTIKRCECFDIDNTRKPIEFIDNVCYIKRAVGDMCDSHTSCNATIPGEAVCLRDPESTNNTMRCQCELFYVHYEPEGQCLPVARNGTNFPCVRNVQCTNSTLGHLSRCSESTKKCECHNPSAPGPENVATWENVCYMKKNFNDTCVEDNECRASINRNAICKEHESWNGEKVCQCAPGKSCKGAASTTGATVSVILIALGFMASRRFAVV